MDRINANSIQKLTDLLVWLQDKTTQHQFVRNVIEEIDQLIIIFRSDKITSYVASRSAWKIIRFNRNDMTFFNSEIGTRINLVMNEIMDDLKEEPKSKEQHLQELAELLNMVKKTSENSKIIPYVIESLELIIESWGKGKIDLKEASKYAGGLSRFLSEDMPFCETELGDKIHEVLNSIYDDARTEIKNKNEFRELSQDSQF